MSNLKASKFPCRILKQLAKVAKTDHYSGYSNVYLSESGGGYLEATDGKILVQVPVETSVSGLISCSDIKLMKVGWYTVFDEEGGTVYNKLGEPEFTFTFSPVEWIDSSTVIDHVNKTLDTNCTFILNLSTIHRLAEIAKMSEDEDQKTMTFILAGTKLCPKLYLASGDITGITTVAPISNLPVKDQINA